MRVILASCQIVTATATNEYSDLFWALSGGTGGNFGVVTQVDYNLVQLPSLWACAISWSAADAAAVLTLMQQQYMVSGCPDQLGYMMNVAFYQGQEVYMVRGMYAGSRADGLAAIQSLLAFPSAQLLVDEVSTYPYLDNYLENNPCPLPDQPDGTPETKASRCISQMMPHSVWQQVVDYLTEQVEPHVHRARWRRNQSLSSRRQPIHPSQCLHGFLRRCVLAKSGRKVDDEELDAGPHEHRRAVQQRSRLSKLSGRKYGRLPLGVLGRCVRSAIGRQAKVRPIQLFPFRAECQSAVANRNLRNDLVKFKCTRSRRQLPWSDAPHPPTEAAHCNVRTATPYLIRRIISDRRS